jgi:hypothetical protein
MLGLFLSEMFVKVACNFAAAAAAVAAAEQIVWQRPRLPRQG